jgi:hypothetical protein
VSRDTGLGGYQLIKDHIYKIWTKLIMILGGKHFSTDKYLHYGKTFNINPIFSLENEIQTHLLTQKLWDVSWDQWEHRNEVVHNQENLVSQSETDQLHGWIREAIRTGSGLVLTGDQYLFLNLSMDSAFQSALARKKQWKRFVEMACKAYQDSNAYARFYIKMHKRTFPVLRLSCLDW